LAGGSTRPTSGTAAKFWNPIRKRGAEGNCLGGSDGVEAQGRALFAEFPRMPATVIAQRIGWQHPMTTLTDRAAAPGGGARPPVGSVAPRGAL
jgi:hypothetical protein